MDCRKLMERCTATVPEVLAFSRQLVNMDSGTGNVEGLRRKAAFLTDALTGIGARVEWLEAAPPREGTWNLAATFRGTGTARILILTHYDTVFPAGEAARRPFRTEGDRALGPGVADMQTSRLKCF